MQLSESLDLSRLLEHYDPGVSSLLRSLLHSMTLVTSAQSTTTYGYEGEKLLQEFEVYEAIGPITFRYPGFSLFLCYDLSQSQLPVSGSARVKAGFGWVSIYCCGNNFESLQHYWHIHMCLGIREPCMGSKYLTWGLSMGVMSQSSTATMTSPSLAPLLAAGLSTPTLSMIRCSPRSSLTTPTFKD